MTAKLPPEIRQIYDRGVVQRADFEWWLDQKGWNPHQLARGELGLTTEQAVFVYVCEDPVLWAQAFLTEPDTGEPYRFWKYQIPSMRAWDQDVIHKDGAEVGKTREIGILIMWACCTGMGGAVPRPWILVGAPQQTHLDEIIMEIEDHAGVAEGREGSKPFLAHFWTKPKRTPHTMLRFLTPNPANPSRPNIARVYFRPAGHDGEAFRGVHVNALAFMDEAAKLKHPKCWDEFFRARKPGCSTRIYSVPDGDNTTRYYQMCRQAVENLPRKQKGWRLFHWPKTIMPAPFWSVERERDFLRVYGSKDSPGYQRNVLGEDGQIENPVWSWDLIKPNVRNVPEYVCLKLVADNRAGDLRVTAYQVELQGGDNRAGREVYLHDKDRPLATVHARDTDERRAAVRDLLREFFTPPGAGVYWIGGDLGFSKDPTELFVFQEIGRELRLVMRLHARGVTYDAQCELIYCLDELLGFAGVWGVDFGSAGTAVVHMLQNLEQYSDGHYDHRLTGFQFAGAVEATDEDGNVLEAEDKRTGEIKPVILPAKEWATELITKRLQVTGFALPPDPDVLQHMTNHTAREGARHRIFSKENDHTLDAMRTMMLRKVFNESGSADVFSSGAHARRVA